MPFDPNTLTKKFEDLFTKMDAIAAAQLAATQFITTYPPVEDGNYANLYDVFAGLGEIRYLYRDPDDSFKWFYTSFKEYLAAIAANTDAAGALGARLDGVVNGLEAVAQAVAQVENQLITANSSLAGILIDLGAGGAGRNNVIGLLNAQIAAAKNCGCTSPYFIPDDCSAPFSSVRVNRATVVEEGPIVAVAQFDGTPPTDIEYQTTDFGGFDNDCVLYSADWTAYNVFVASNALFYSIDDSATFGYETNKWMTMPLAEGSVIFNVPDGSSLTVTLCPITASINPACIYQIGSFTDSFGRNIAQWADGPGVIDGGAGLLDPAYFNDWWLQATGSDQLSIVLTNTFFYDFDSNTPYPIGFLPDTFVVLCNNGGSISQAHLCPQESQL